MQFVVNALFVIMILVKVIFMCPKSISHLHTRTFSSSCESLRSARGTVCKSGAYLWATRDLRGPSTTWAQPPESLKSDFGIHFPSSHSRPSAPSRPERHLPPPTSEQPFNICARISSQFSIHAVRHIHPTFYIYIWDANKTWLGDVVLYKRHQGWCYLEFFFIFEFFFYILYQWGGLCNRRIDGHTRLRVTSLTCTGTGWRFWLVDCEKIPFRGGWWHIYWACQINKSNELSQDKGHNNTQTHINTQACMDRGRGRESVFLKSRSCASIKHWSPCHLGLFRAPAELFDVSDVRKEMWTEFYLTNSAPQTAGIHSKLLERQTSNYTGTRWADAQIHRIEF